MLSYAEALAIIADLPQVEGTETLPLGDCYQRTLATPLRARLPSPAFTNSAMDGYAVRHDEAKLGPLAVAGTIYARPVQAEDAVLLETHWPGTCVRIMTGAVMPTWADTVVPVEQAQVHPAPQGQSAEMLQIANLPPIGSHVRHQGEDLPEGATILPAGSWLDAERLMVAAAFGYDALTVRARPEVVICPTGDELVEPGQALPRGGVYDSNKFFLAAAARGLGLQARVSPTLADDAAKAADFVQTLLANPKPTLLLTTGAVSAGALDFVPNLAAALGFTTCFHKVAIRPGRPVFLARRDQVMWLGLPGNPLAACVGWYYFVRPLLTAVAGVPAAPKRWLTMANDVRKPEGLTCFFRADLQSDGARVSVPQKQGSAQYSASLTNGAYVALPAGATQISAETRVEVIII